MSYPWNYFVEIISGALMIEHGPDLEKEKIQHAISAYMVATGSMHAFVPPEELDYKITHPQTDEFYPVTEKCMLQFIWIGKTKRGRDLVVSEFYDGTETIHKDQLIDKFLAHVIKIVDDKIKNYRQSIVVLNKLMAKVHSP